MSYPQMPHPAQQARPATLPGRRASWPFVLLLLLPPPLALVIWFVPYRLSPFGRLPLGVFLGLEVLALVAVVVGLAATIGRERTLAADQTTTPKPAWPFIVMAVLALPWGFLQLFFSRGGIVGLIGPVVSVVIPLLVCGITCAVIRSRAGRDRWFGGHGQAGPYPGAHPAAPIGHTFDGQPIYPVIGYTPAGIPVTANQGFAMQSPPAGTSGMAIGAFIAAFVFPLAGVILGHVARSQIRRTGQEGDGLALAALVVSYVLLALNVAVAIFLVVASQGRF